MECGKSLESWYGLGGLGIFQKKLILLESTVYDYAVVMTSISRFLLFAVSVIIIFADFGACSIPLGKPCDPAAQHKGIKLIKFA